MSSEPRATVAEPRAFIAVDRGTATVAVTLLGRVDRRWRLLGSTAAPVSVPADALVARLCDRLSRADSGLADAIGLGLPGAAAALPRVESRTAPPPEITVVAATERALGPMADAAALGGWRVHRVALEGAGILAVATALANPRSRAVLAGAGDPPGADERPLMGELAAQVGAAAERRPDLTVVLAGALGAPGGRYEARIPPDRPGSILVAGSPGTGGGGALRTLLEGVRAGPDDGRRALAAATATLSEVLERSVEVVDIGQSAGTRVIAEHAPGSSADVTSAVVVDAALLPRGFGDAHLDAIGGWLPVQLDRLRMRDRLRELALVPWGDAAGEGALLRLAAARAALERLHRATRWMDGRRSDLLVAAGGAWSVAPGPAVALALADVLRRPGLRALGLDHARLLGPLGTIEDPRERRAVIADLRDELLLPLGSVLMAAGMHHGRPAGRLVMHLRDGETGLDLVPGGIQRIHLPPGERAIAELRFRDTLDVGVKARHMAVEVAGGLAGLVVDLRDIPLRAPDRPERRRAAIAAWNATVWPGVEA